MSDFLNASYVRADSRNLVSLGLHLSFEVSTQAVIRTFENCRADRINISLIIANTLLTFKIHLKLCAYGKQFLRLCGHNNTRQSLHTQNERSRRGFRGNLKRPREKFSSLELQVISDKLHENTTWWIIKMAARNHK